MARGRVVFAARLLLALLVALLLLLPAAATPKGKKQQHHQRRRRRPGPPRKLPKSLVRMSLPTGAEYSQPREQALDEEGRNIFVYWATGFDTAPPIVELCVSSWRELNPKWKLHKLSLYNLGTYTRRLSCVELCCPC